MNATELEPGDLFERAHSRSLCLAAFITESHLHYLTCDAIIDDDDDLHKTVTLKAACGSI